MHAALAALTAKRRTCEDGGNKVCFTHKGRECAVYAALTARDGSETEVNLSIWIRSIDAMEKSCRSR
jgi:hypothetical protein